MSNKKLKDLVVAQLSSAAADCPALAEFVMRTALEDIFDDITDNDEIWDFCEGVVIKAIKKHPPAISQERIEAVLTRGIEKRKDAIDAVVDKVITDTVRGIVKDLLKKGTYKVRLMEIAEGIVEKYVQDQR